MADQQLPTYMDPKEIQEVLYTEEQIRERVKEMGKQISESYSHQEQPLIVIATLKGATVFFADLVRELNLDCVWEFMSFSSYGMNSSSSGAVQLVLDLKMDIQGRDVLVVEDILDTGNTLKYMMKQLQAREPKSLKTVVLLHKHEMTVPGVSCDFVGWKVPNQFLVGYGLDYAQKYRSLKFVGILAPWVYAKPDAKDGSIACGDVSMPKP